MKIFMGLNNIASLMRDYKEGFTALGHECFCVSKYEAPIVDGPVDMIIPQVVQATLRKKNDFSPSAQQAALEHAMGLAWQKALEADICFFMWETFRHNASDLAQLKQMGKRIVVRLCGSEVRDPHVDTQYAAHYGLQSVDYGLPTDVQTLRAKLRYLRRVERYADVVIAGSAMSLRPIHWRGACLFSQEGLVRRTARQRSIPVLLHAPSRQSTKGTDIWIAVFNALRDHGLSFGLKLVENIPHADMLKEYATADIVCGSLVYGGRASWEAMAAGCVHAGVSVNGLVGHRDDEMTMLAGLNKPQDDEHLAWLSGVRDHFAPLAGSPNVAVTPQNVAQTLADLIMDLPRRQAMADAGPVFVDTWLSPTRVCQGIIDSLYEPPTHERLADSFLTTFFRQHYMPPENGQECIKLFNSYNKFVSRCDWYQQFVPSGQRAGLVF